ncbi:MAG: hypothetical protein ACFFD1_12505 [Candidatus Thorarchaeota archaeon]
MSQGKSDKSQALISDFAYAVNDVLDFLHKSRQRSLEDLQKKVIIKGNLEALKDAINSLSFSLNIDPETKANLYFETIPKLTSILNMVSPKGDLENIWLELNALSNMIIVSLINFRSTGDIWAIQASSNLIVKILSGIPQINELPEIPSPIDEPQKFRETFAVTVNSLQFTGLVYFAVIYSLPTIYEDDMIKWANKSFYHFNLLLSLYEKIDYYKAFPSYKNDVDKFYLNISINSSVFLNLPILLTILYKKFGDEWPSSIETHKFIPNTTLSGLITYNKNFRDYSIKLHNIVNDLYNSGIIDVNINPNDDQNIQNMKDTIKTYESVISNYEALDLGLNFDLEQDLENLLKKLDDAESLAFWYLEYLKALGGDDLNSEGGQAYIEQFVVLLELWVLKSYWTKSIEYFSAKITEYDEILSKVDPGKFLELPLKVLLAKLFLETHFGLKTDLKLIRDRLTAMRFKITHRPRDLLAVTLLETILSYYLGDRSIFDLEQPIQEFKSLFFDYGQTHLVFDYEQYLLPLINAFNGKKADFLHKAIEDHCQINKLDSYTWLVPVFDKIAEETNKIPISYIPFNRDFDSIVPGKSTIKKKIDLEKINIQ